MDRTLLEFATLLRQNGVRVSLAENMDGFRAVRLVGLGDRELLKDTLRATLVKRAADIPTFDELFDVHFTGLGDAVRRHAEQLMATLQLDPAAFQHLLEQLEATLDSLGIELSDLARFLLGNNTGELERLLREAARAADVRNIRRAFEEGRYSHAVAQALGLGGLAAELDGLKRRLDEAAGLTAAERERLREFIDRRLQDLTALIKRTVRLELEKQDAALRDTRRLEALAEKSFYYLSEEEIRRMREAVTRLARRLKNVAAIRRQRAKRGTFDVKGTLRQNLQYGGVPFRIRLDRRVRERPQVVVLCDVSDSVRNVSRFMLQFMYSLQDLYARVRSFIFVSDIGEVTHLFDEQDVAQAVEQALAGGIINVFAHSDFGRAFRAFHRDHIGSVTRKTTVLILGDARNNYNAPHEWVLREIRQRAKQLIWLNPESRMTWGFGDSEMHRYLPYCDVAEECRNLKQLYRVIDRLVS